METPSCCAHKKKPWFKEPFYIILLILGAIFIINIFLISSGIYFLSPVIEKYLDYLSKTWWAIGLGLIIGSLIDALVPESLMARLLANGKKSIILAVGLGFLASACSHGILAIAVSLYKKGASTASTMAFLLAAPWANLSITILLFSLFGLKALFIVGGALLVAVISGFIFEILEKKGIIEQGKSYKNNLKGKKVKWIFPGWKILFQKVSHEFWSLTKSVVWWVLFGFLLASILGTYLPESFMNKYFGANIFGLIATLALASVIEICSEGSAPLAFELFNKTRAFGNAFVFLQAGVVTDLTEIGLIWTNIGKKAAISLVLVGVPLILILGFIFNNLIKF